MSDNDNLELEIEIEDRLKGLSPLSVQTALAGVLYSLEQLAGPDSEDAAGFHLLRDAIASVVVS